MAWRHDRRCLTSTLDRRRVHLAGITAHATGTWVYDIAFVANNPGIRMNHRHNLQHAIDGLVAHLMYEGVTTPFVMGGRSRSEPE